MLFLWVRLGGDSLLAMYNLYSIYLFIYICIYIYPLFNGCISIPMPPRLGRWSPWCWWPGPGRFSPKFTTKCQEFVDVQVDRATKLGWATKLEIFIAKWITDLCLIYADLCYFTVNETEKSQTWGGFTHVTCSSTQYGVRKSACARATSWLRSWWYLAAP